MIGARRLLFPECRTRGVRYSSSITAGLYEALGVEKTASSDDIKSAFRKKAKAHHPDLLREESGTDFAVILKAYQVLSDPAQRQLYDLQHDTGSAGFLRQAASRKREFDAAAGERVEWGWEWMQDMDPQNTRPARQGSNVDRLRAELQAEFRDALLHAYHGPQVDMAARRLPDAFEADERTDRNAADILQLLSGRQLLGVVRERRSPLLADNARESAALPRQAPLHQLNGDSAERIPDAGAGPAAETTTQQDGGGAAEPSRHASASSDGAGGAGPQHTRRRLLELLFGEGEVQHWLGTSSLLFASVLCGRRGSAGGSGGASGGAGGAWHPHLRPRRRVLELLFGEGEVAAVGVQHAAGRRASTFEVFNGDELVYSETDGRVTKPGGAGGGRQTHRAVLSNTPFVKHLDFVVLQGVGGLKKDRVICRAKRAWLPPPATWLFKPRNATHTSGGWYFEWMGWSRHTNHPAWLHPHAMVLRAAFETLEAETAAAAAAAAAAAGQEDAAGSEAPAGEEGAPQGIWTRLKSKLARSSR